MRTDLPFSSEHLERVFTARLFMMVEKELTVGCIHTLTHQNGLLVLIRVVPMLC